MENTKYVNVAFKAFATTTLYNCDIEDIKVGDFVVVPSWTGELTGRVVSFTKTKTTLGKKPQNVLRKATPQEINEVADVFGIPKDPALAEDDDDESFLTNSGYGTKELNKIMKKYQKKAEEKEAAANDEPEEKQKVQNLTPSVIKEDSSIPGYFRYVAVGILALYFIYNYME